MTKVKYYVILIIEQMERRNCLNCLNFMMETDYCR
nr:MAG TPA: hypothetical protein [Caudoviricetes sp.]